MDTKMFLSKIQCSNAEEMLASLYFKLQSQPITVMGKINPPQHLTHARNK